MITVTLCRTALCIDVEDHLVFPIEEVNIKIPPGQAGVSFCVDDKTFKKMEAEADQKARYAAWDARLNRDSEKVFKGWCAGKGACYVILTERQYNPGHPPRPVATKEEDDEVITRAADAAKKAAAEAARIALKKTQRDKFEWIPKSCSGVDWGCAMRVMVRTRLRSTPLLVAYRPGHTAYIDRGSGSVYSKGELTVFRYTHDPKANSYFSYTLSDPEGRSPLGQDIPLPDGWRMSGKGIKAIHHLIAKALNIDVKKLEGWSGEKTLVLG